MNTPRLEFSALRRTRLQERVRRSHRAVGAALLGTGAVITVAAHADWSTDPAGPLALSGWTAGVCAGLRAAGSQDPDQPIDVTVFRAAGNVEFRCAPHLPGRELPPVQVTLQGTF
jgi:hypothetical protein